MKKSFAILASLVMIVGVFGVVAAPQQAQVEKPEGNPEGEYYTYFDKWNANDDPPYSTVWCEPEMADMLFKTEKSEAWCKGSTKAPAKGNVIGCRIHISAYGEGGSNVKLVYLWGKCADVREIEIPPNDELYATTVNFIEEDAFTDYQAIKVYVDSKQSANVVVDVKWFYVGDEKPYKPTTPPYYLHFDKSEGKASGNAKAWTNNKYADMALFTGQPDGRASATGSTKTWYDYPCLCPYVGVKVHIIGSVKGRGWAEATTIYEWDDHTAKKEWTFFGGPGEGKMVDEIWTYTDYFFLSELQSLTTDLSVGSAIDANLFIDVEWFYEGCGPPNPPAT